jgi:NitT/TauT family transport system substrate-binding protein
MIFRQRAARWVGGAVAVLGLTLAGCGGGSSESTEGTSGATASGASGATTPVKLQLQWFAQSQFAGYYVAKEKGFFAAEGLDVTIVEGGADIVPQDVLASGDVDYAIAWVPKVLGSIEQGAKVTNVAQIFQRSGTLQISKKDANITKPADLKGKKVGSWGFGNEFELFAGMQKNGVQVGDISLVQQAFDMNGFLAGDIDAAQAMIYNEYAQVLEAKNPTTGKLFTAEELNVIDWNTVGTAMLQDAIWANTDKLSDEAYKKQTVALIKGAIKGWAYARDNPEEAAKIVTAAGSTLGQSHQLWMANEINKLIWPSPNGIGMVDETAWKQTVTVALGTKNESGSTIITKEPPSTAYTTEYVKEALTALESEQIDTKGTAFKPITVTLTEGGK